MVNKLNVQEVKPQRTCQTKKTRYSAYKLELREDFNNRCGYCDDEDYHAGGKSGYQIDHFKPKSIPRFEVLEHDYSNLVYSCPYCNRAKWNKWKDSNGFIDPCSTEYKQHLCRDKHGKICHTTKQGKYIFTELNLGLKRHEILWIIRKIEVQKCELEVRIQMLKKGHAGRLKALEQFLEIQNLVDKYTRSFRDSI